MRAGASSTAEIEAACSLGQGPRQPDEFTARSKIARAQTRLSDHAERWCFDAGLDTDTLFPATCAGKSTPWDFSKCVADTVGVERLTAFKNWARINGYKAFLGEFGGPPTHTCIRALDSMLNYLGDNDVWMGWSSWAAGP